MVAGFGMSYLSLQPDTYIPHGADGCLERRFRASFEHAPVGMAHVAPDGRFLAVNDQFFSIAGHSRAALLADGFQNITHPNDLTMDLSHVRDLLEGRAHRYAMEKRYIRASGETVWINLTVSLIRDDEDNPEFFIAVIEDLSEIKRAQADALIDPLTGLFNRRGIIERLNQEIRLASAARTALGVLYIDLDNFKEINDQYGHPDGDECLLRVAESMTADARIEHASARIGGDEFVMILPRADRDQLAVTGVRIQSAIRKSAPRKPWRISASLGGASVVPFDPISPQQLIGWADEAMFVAKRGGKDRLHISGALN